MRLRAILPQTTVRAAVASPVRVKSSDLGSGNAEVANRFAASRAEERALDVVRGARSAELRRLY
jgi:hypothetical protein